MDDKTRKRLTLHPHNLFVLKPELTVNATQAAQICTSLAIFCLTLCAMLGMQSKFDKFHTCSYPCIS